MLWLILLCAFLVKVPALTQPFIGYFASYQAINAMMGEMMIRGGDFLSWVTPRSFLLMEGRPSLHLLYYPFGSLAAAVLNFLGGGIAFWGRFQAAFFTGLATLCFFKTLKPFEPEKDKIFWAVLFFSFSPMVLIEGVCFQNEAAALFFLTAASALLAQRTSAGRALAAGILFSLTMTARLHFMFVAPIFLYLLFLRRAPVRQWAIFFIASALPVCAWFAWTWILEQQFPSQTATSMFGQTQEGRILKGSLFASPHFYFGIFKTLFTQFLTPLGLLAAVYGFFKAPRVLDLYRIWFFFGLTVIVLLPQKVLDHPFYLIAAVPGAAVLAASSFSELWSRFRKLSFLFLGLFILLSLRYYIPPAFSFGVSREIPAIGQKVKELTQLEDKVIASHGTSNDLLFYSGRTGWAFDLKMEEHPLSDQARYRALKKLGYGNLMEWFKTLKTDGARYLVISEPEVFAAQKVFFNFINSTYKELPEGSGKFRIYDLER